jgi:hypothetical protein
MIQPIKNVVSQEGDSYLVLPGGHFGNVFLEETHPTLFVSQNTYLGFLRDDIPPTIYEVMRWDSTPLNKPVEIRRLSETGAERVQGWIEPMLQAYVDKANAHIRKNVARFKEHLQSGAVCEAEEDIAATRQSLEITVGQGFPFPYVRLPEGLYDRLETFPDNMIKELKPEMYRQSVQHYLNMASTEGNQGWSNMVNLLCNKAAYCAKKGFEVDNLQPVLDTISKVRETSLATAKSIERDKELISRFDWRRPNTRESWLTFELGFDPFDKSTPKDYAEMCAAEQRLSLRGLNRTRFG